MEYKKLPISEQKLSQMREQDPRFFDNLIKKYGIENIKNNLLVDVVILQEEKSIIDSNGDEYPITAEIIDKVYNATNSVFNKMVTEPYNKLKSWFGNDYVGNVSISTDHADTMANHHGWLDGSSLTIDTVNGKKYLRGQFLAVSPEAKYNIVQGLWRDVSPSINADLQDTKQIKNIQPVWSDKYRLLDISFVVLPAQINNSILSSGAKPMTRIKELDNEITNLKAGIDKLDSEYGKEIKEIDAYVQGLVNNQTITSAYKNRVTKSLLKLKSGEIPYSAAINVVTDAVKHSPFSKPNRSIYNLKGAMQMPTRDEMRSKFVSDEENQRKYPEAKAMTIAFEDYMINFTKSTQLSQGAGAMTSADELIAQLNTMIALDPSIADKISQLKSGEKTVDAGGTEQPNNANLNSDEETDMARKRSEMSERLLSKFMERDDEYKKLSSEHEMTKKERDELKAGHEAMSKEREKEAKERKKKDEEHEAMKKEHDELRAKHEEMCSKMKKEEGAE